MRLIGALTELFAGLARQFGALEEQFAAMTELFAAKRELFARLAERFAGCAAGDHAMGLAENSVGALVTTRLLQRSPPVYSHECAYGSLEAWQNSGGPTIYPHV
jgi:hypothetical protein